MSAGHLKGCGRTVTGIDLLRNRRTGVIPPGPGRDLDLATTRAQYITGEQALNLNDRQSGSHGGTADWRAWWLRLRLAATHEDCISV